MEFEHISDNAIADLYSVNQTSRLKPHGLWFSYPGKWTTFSQCSGSWTYTLSLAVNMFHTYPWCLQSAQPNKNIIKLDVANRIELDTFIGKYRCADRMFEIDWRRVQYDYGGVFFCNVNNIQPSYYHEFNQSDGCWIISLDVDSLCVWDAGLLRHHEDHERSFVSVAV